MVFLNLYILKAQGGGGEEGAKGEEQDEEGNTNQI